MNDKSIIKYYDEHEDKDRAVEFLAGTNECAVERILEIVKGKRNEPSEGRAAEGKRAMGKKLDYEKVQALYDAGKSDADIVRELGTGTASAIYLWRKRNGLPAHGKSKPPKPEKTAKPERAAAPVNAASEPAGVFDILRPLMDICRSDDTPAIKAGLCKLAAAMLKREYDRLVDAARNRR
ncbi:MAG: hypothetical protein LBS19_10970 [Clostridiales bacterium]|nr:hypothetical protein [Clostridiales bacterium]